MPRIAAIRSSCSAAREACPSRNGPAVARGPGAASREPREPAAVVAPLLARRRGRRARATRSSASAPTCAHENHGPATPSASKRTRSTPGPTPGRPPRRAADPPGAGARARGGAAWPGQPPMPRLPSSSSAVPQRPAAGHPVEDRPLEHRCAARVAASASAGGETSMPSVTTPAPRQREHVAARTAADVEHRPVDQLEQPIVGRGRGLDPAPTVEPRRHVPDVRAQRDAGHDALATGASRLRPRRPRPRTAIRERSAATATRVGEVVDVAELGQRAAVRRPELPQPVRAAPRRCRASSSARRRRRRGSGRDEPEAPPSAVGRAARAPRRPPATRARASASREERDRELRCVHADEERRPVDARRTRPRAGRRARRRPAGRPSNDRRQPGPGAGRRARARAGGPAPRATVAERVGERGRRDRRGLRRACTAGRGASSPVRAGATSRARAASRRSGGHRSTPAMSCTARTVPASVPVTFERPMRGAYAHRDAPRCASPRRPRGAPSRAASRTAIVDAEREQAAPPGRPHRSEVA